MNTPHHILRTFDDPEFHELALRAVSHAARGAGDLGRALVLLSTVNDGDPESWTDAWMRNAAALRRRALSAQIAGATQTAAWFHLAACESLGQARAFTRAEPGDDERGAWEAFLEARAANTSARLEAGSADAYLIPPTGLPQPRPTVVIIGARHEPLASLWASTGAGATTRGWNAVLFEQGPDPTWPDPLSRVVDGVGASTAHASRELLAWGTGEGGYWLPQALSTQERFLAAVADPGRSHLPGVADSNVFAPFSTPLLVTTAVGGDGETEAEAIYAAARGPRALARFSADDGLLDQSVALSRGVVELRIHDFFQTWLDRHRATGTPAHRAADDDD